MKVVLEEKKKMPFEIIEFSTFVKCPFDQAFFLSISLAFWFLSFFTNERNEKKCLTKSKKTLDGQKQE